MTWTWELGYWILGYWILGCLPLIQLLLCAKDAQTYNKFAKTSTSASAALLAVSVEIFEISCRCARCQIAKAEARINLVLVKVFPCCRMGGPRFGPPPLTHLPKISKRKDSENEAVLSHKTNLEKSDLEKPIWNGETTRNEMRSNTYSIWLTLASAFAI